MTVEPLQDHKDTRPPLWTLPVLIVAVRMLQTRNERPLLYLRDLLVLPPESHMRTMFRSIALSHGQRNFCRLAQVKGAAIIPCLCHAGPSSFVSCICLQGPLRCAACHYGCLAPPADRPPAYAWGHHTVLAALPRFEALSFCQTTSVSYLMECPAIVIQSCPVMQLPDVCAAAAQGAKLKRCLLPEHTDVLCLHHPVWGTS